jgi:hypothetical protein
MGKKRSFSLLFFFFVSLEEAVQKKKRKKDLEIKNFQLPQVLTSQNNLRKPTQDPF